ncbi:PilW family protein [Acinetobacter tibetensis]|jgi:type IV pilus assembly protein PilW|uniref:PilW family protein n=1 Tax=Acinetobacter tibetensis TaxID=2943497 RepID=A0AAE9S0A9_9GAMM|nr:PilW family protein [Acinetobacter tibetensis]USE83526.1 PilW family protein [Acinetobacter tibetensis]
MIRQSGFTLIELVLSLALGLIITAAAILLFLTSQRSLSLQQGLSDVQDNANFGLNYLTKDIRLANLNNPKSILNDETAYGGVVLTSSINATKDTQTTPPTPLSNLVHTIIGTTANVNLVSRSSGMTVGTVPAWSGVSNVQVNGSDISSDQLVIQYVPQYLTDDKGTASTSDDVLVGGYDCEGNKLEFPVNDPLDGKPFGPQVVVQRYFLRADDNNVKTEPNQPLALACDAGHYATTGDPTVVTRYGDAGEIVMKRVDYFRVLLGVQNDNQRRYISVNDYMTLATPRPRIVSLQLGLLTRSAQNVGNDTVTKDDQEFVVLDQTVKVKKPSVATTKYVRQVVSQTVALRNSVGERGE